MKQRFVMTHGVGTMRAYIVWDTANGSKQVARFSYKTELQRGHAYTLAKADMQERNGGTR